MTETDKLLNQAMLLLAQQPRTLFVGQNVAYDGNVMYAHLEGVPSEQRIEWPVAEELQMGASIGLALQGFLVVSVYPRMDFLLRAADSLVNHLDKLWLMTNGAFKPKVIIRTKVGSKKPLDAGPQHTQRHTFAFNHMLDFVTVREITHPSDIMLAYRAAIEREHSTLIVENIQ